MEIQTNLSKVVNSWVRKKINQLSSVEKIQAGVKENETYENGVSLSKVMLCNEFGTSKIPSRPALRITIKDNLEEWYNILIKELEKEKTLLQASHVIGLKMKADIIKSISSDIPPVNSLTTLIAYRKYLQGKKLSKNKVVQGVLDKKTLIFTGKLVKSMTYQVFRKKK